MFYLKIRTGLTIFFSLLTCLLIPTTPIMAQTATSTVGLTITGAAADSQAQTAKKATLDQQHAAWLATQFEAETPVEVVEVIDGQTNHYWEYPDGTTTTTAPNAVASTTHVNPKSKMPKISHIGQLHTNFKHLANQVKVEMTQTPLTQLITATFH